MEGPFRQCSSRWTLPPCHMALSHWWTVDLSHPHAHQWDVKFLVLCHPVLLANLSWELQWYKQLLFYSCYLQLIWTLFLRQTSELRLVGVSFEFKFTFNLHTVLSFHGTFPTPLPDSPHPKISTSFLAIVHDRQYFQEFYASSLCTVPLCHLEGQTKLLFDSTGIFPSFERTQQFPSTVTMGFLYSQTLEKWRKKYFV